MSCSGFWRYWQEVDSELLQLKDEANRKWVRAWKKAVKEGKKK